MAQTTSFFTDGDAYERMMGRWSHAVGEIFLDWLAPAPGLGWLDVGCGTGAFTALVGDRSAPASRGAIDPSEAQIAFARDRPGAGDVDFRVGDAQSLPYADGAFDVAAMALVINFIPDPAKAVAEMKRVVRPGGTVATYIWDMPGKGFTQQPLRDAIGAMGIEPGSIMNPEITRLDALGEMFAAAGLDDVSTRAIEIEVSYSDFDDYWDSETALVNPTVQVIRDMSADDVDRLQASLKDRLPTDSDGRIAYKACANAVKGRVPAA